MEQQNDTMYLMFFNVLCSKVSNKEQMPLCILFTLLLHLQWNYFDSSYPFFKKIHVCEFITHHHHIGINFSVFWFYIK